MGHIEAEREIPVIPDALWAILSDVRSWERWFTLHADWAAEPPAAIAQGTTIVENIEMLEIANTIEWTVLDLEAPTNITIAGTGLGEVEMRFDFTVKPAYTGTKLKLSADFDSPLIKGVLSTVIAKEGFVQLNTMLRRLEEVAQAQPKPDRGSSWSCPPWSSMTPNTRTEERHFELPADVWGNTAQPEMVISQSATGNA